MCCSTTNLCFGLTSLLEVGEIRNSEMYARESAQWKKIFQYIFHYPIFIGMVSIIFAEKNFRSMTNMEAKNLKHMRVKEEIKAPYRNYTLQAGRQMILGVQHHIE